MLLDKRLLVLIEIQTKSFERKIKSLLPNGLKSFFIHILCNDFMGYLIKSSGIKTNLFGGFYNYQLIENKYCARIFFGFYEACEIKFSKKYVSCSNVIELGASIGVTLGVISKKSKKKKFVSIEANPKNYRILKSLISYLPKDNEYLIYNKAIAYDIPFVDFSIRTITGSKIANEFEKNDQVIKVSTITLSQILKNEDIRGPYTLITDIEGAESEIFFNDEEALNNCIEMICELENTIKYSIKDQLDKLLSIGFFLLRRDMEMYFF